MASKLKIHAEFIDERFNKGDSYASITRELEQMGCKTSVQNLFVWLKRRSAKLKARQALICSSHLPLESQPASTTSAVQAVQAYKTEPETNKANQNLEKTTQIKDRAAENDFLRSLSKKCPASLLPIIFYNKKS